eukprot:m.111195 g.111195  ORF g.111195 m.111195 type:complete len:186 (+) comp51818_c0_seq18:493-1050(+)
MRVKHADRVTVMLATNATGSHKLPLFMIGKSKIPHCFRMADAASRQHNVTYASQSNSWMDSETCSRWFSSVFLPAIRAKHGSQKVVLYWDNAPAHPNTFGIDSQVKIIFLPENLTSRYQPLDAGVISAFKRRYRTSLLDAYDAAAKDIAHFRDLRRKGASASKGMRGVQFAMKANVLAMDLAYRA